MRFKNSEFIVEVTKNLTSVFVIHLHHIKSAVERPLDIGLTHRLSAGSVGTGLLPPRIGKQRPKENVLNTQPENPT